MDTLGSILLFISLATGGLAFLLALTLYIKQPHPRRRRLVPFGRAIMLIYSVALVALLGSLMVHIFSGHRPDSTQALGVTEFFAIHPAYLVATALPLLAGIMAWRYCRRHNTWQGDGQS